MDAGKKHKYHVLAKLVQLAEFCSARWGCDVALFQRCRTSYDSSWVLEVDGIGHFEIDPADEPAIDDEDEATATGEATGTGKWAVGGNGPASDIAVLERLGSEDNSARLQELLKQVRTGCIDKLFEAMHPIWLKRRRELERVNVLHTTSSVDALSDS